MTFDPNEKRDQDGKWTTGGGSPQPPIEPVTPPAVPLVTVEFARERANAIAKEMGFDPSRIDISEEQPTFVLNGKTYTTGGLADTHLPEGTGRVTIFRRSLHPDNVDGILVHEIEHMKFQTVLNRYNDENNNVLGKDPGPAPDPNGKYYWQRNGGIDAIMAPDGSLREGYKEKYPTYTAVQEALYQYGTDEFAKTDGVSPYSYDWWVAYMDGKASSTQAFHETLAEMARVKRMTGAFPEHMGPNVLEYRAKSNRALINSPDFNGDVPKMTKADIAKGTKMWRELYRTVDRLTK